jgi:hypothetical protein
MSFSLHDVPNIRVSKILQMKDVGGRDEPGHEEEI